MMKHTLFYSLIITSLLLTACTVKQNPVIVKFEGSFSEKKWALKDLNPEIPADWTPYSFLTFEFNASTTQRFELILYDAQGIRKLQILPFQGAWVSASIPLIHFQKMNTKRNRSGFHLENSTARLLDWVYKSGRIHQSCRLTWNSHVSTGWISNP